MMVVGPPPPQRSSSPAPPSIVAGLAEHDDPGDVRGAEELIVVVIRGPRKVRCDVHLGRTAMPGHGDVNPISTGCPTNPQRPIHQIHTGDHRGRRGRNRPRVVVGDGQANGKRPARRIRMGGRDSSSSSCISHRSISRCSITPVDGGRMTVERTRIGERCPNTDGVLIPTWRVAFGGGLTADQTSNDRRYITHREHRVGRIGETTRIHDGGRD